VKKYLALIVGLGLLFFGSLFVLNLKTVWAAGDCDTNAVIYCGIDSRTDLKEKLAHGTGKSHQSSKELTALFAKYNAHPSEFNSLKLGKVKRDNKVYVNGKVVASNVFTMGRHNIQPGSAKISGLAYPLYKRHPGVSFNSSELDAYVYLNYDGSMRYAVIKSCGNIVMGVVRNRPDQPTPPPTPQSTNLIIRKFDDQNGNRVQDIGEELLAGWEFRVSGPGLNQVVTTLPNGTVTLTGLTPGMYTVTEVLQSGWRNTTGLSVVRNVTTDAATQTFMFGNQAVDTPVTPSGGGDIAVLPTTGTREWVLAGLVLVLLGAGLWWVRSKDMLRLARRRKPTGATRKKKRVSKRK
jgi:hypothetical protein